MAASLNKATLIGSLGKDPEIKSFSNGNRVANFSIATSESWKDKSTGEKKERTQWHRICIFNEHLIAIAEKHLRKGMSVYIEGQIETREYEKGGTKHYTTEIVLRPYNGEIKILTWPKEKTESGGDVDESEPTTTALHQSAKAEKDAKGSPIGGDINDEIPF